MKLRPGLLLTGLLAVLLAGPGLALANPTVTITFEGGTFDPSPPPGLEGTPDVFEGGAHYSGFWFEDAGTPGAYHGLGHTHVIWDNTAASLVDNPHAWRDGMQGVTISMLNGSSFRVVSIDYRIIERLPSDGLDPNSQFARLPWSNGWEDVHLLLSEAADPVTPDFATFESQWTSFSIDDGSEFDLGGGLSDPYRPAADTPWKTLQVTGFDDVTEVFIGHTASWVAIDSIVLETTAGAGAPEPGTGVLLGVGLGLLAGRRRAQHRD